MLSLLSKYIDKDAFIESIIQKAKCHSNIIFDSFVSNSCNLSCTHCYFLDYKPSLAPITSERWSQVIDECIENGIKHFHFSGKEPFCDKRIYSLLAKLDSLVSDNRIFYGVVSNGTAVQPSKYIELLNSNISYLEISIEGSDYYNNSIRGKSHFEKVDELIREINDKTKINITSTVSESNIDSLIEMMQYMIKQGISKFNIAPLLCFKKERLKPVKNVNTDTMVRLYTECCKLLSSLGKEVEDSIDVRICLSQEQAYHLFINRNSLSDYIEKHIYEGREMVSYIGQHIIEINYPLLQIPFLSQLVATHDGYIISCADDIHFKDIDRISLGNIKNESIQHILTTRELFIKDFLFKELY